jgi:hypothetical protein
MATMAVPVVVYVLGAAAVAVEHSTRQGVIGMPTSLPEWPLRTIAVLVTVDDSPHAIPVSAPVRAGDDRILLSLHRTRDSLGRLRDRPQVALAILAEATSPSPRAAPHASSTNR